MSRRHGDTLPEQTRPASAYDAASPGNVSIPWMTGVLTLRRGLITSFTPSAEDLFGYTAAEVVGRAIDTLLPSLGGTPGERTTALARRKDGLMMPVHVDFTAIGDADLADEVCTVRSGPASLDARSWEESAVRYQLLAENTREIILFMAKDGQIMEANRAAQAAYGYTRTELLQMRFSALQAAETVGSVGEQAAVADGPTSETAHRRKDGTIFPVEVSSSSGRLHGAEVQLSIIRPTGPRKLLENVQMLLREIDQAILQKQPLDELPPYICHRVCSLFGFHTAWIGLRRRDGRVLVQARGGADSSFLDKITVRWDDTPKGNGPTGRAIRLGQAQAFSASAENPGLSPWPETLREQGLTYALALPLIHGGETFGALTMYADQNHAFDSDLTELLSHFANQAAISIMAARDQEQIMIQRTALNAAANAVVLTDRRGRILWANPAWERLTGYASSEVLGRTPRILNSGRHDRQYYVNLWKTILSGQVWFGTLWNRRKDGTVYLDEQTITPVLGADGTISHFIAIKQDVTERKRQEERLQHLATHDPLTDLPNRRQVNEWTWQLVADAAGGRHGALLLLGIDRFKSVNDSLGHIVGDELLVRLSQVLRTMLRPEDRLARLGGDEFAVLLQDINLEEAMVMGERLRRAVDEHRFYSSGTTCSLSVSVGISLVDGAASPNQVMARASDSLSAAKERGGNRVMLYRTDEKREERVAHAGLWATRIKDALREDRMRLHFQPIVRLADDAVRYYEVLMRMEDEVGNLLPPSSFLQAAEEFGLMGQVDRWVVRKALETLKVVPRLRLFINLSAQSLNDDAVLTEIEREIKSSGVEPARLTFEITETAAVKDFFQSRQGMNRLNDLGCSFALDDFGTGFSSFRYLRDLPAQYIKIDGFFIKNLDADPANLTLVRAITTAAQEMGKTVIAEWVESPQAARLLAGLGVEFGQGFHFGRPGPEAA